MSFWITSFILMAGVFALQLYRMHLLNAELREYAQAIARERTRAHFAETRRLLLQMVSEEKVRAKSTTFETLYKIQTFIMRRPDEYEPVAALFAWSILNKEHVKDGSLTAESKYWNDDIRKVVLQTAEGVDLLIEKHLGEQFKRSFAEIRGLQKQLDELKKQSQRQTESDKKLIVAQQRMRELAAV
jgi:hypothetical protein